MIEGVILHALPDWIYIQECSLKDGVTHKESHLPTLLHQDYTLLVDSFLHNNRTRVPNHYKILIAASLYISATCQRPPKEDS